MRQLPQANKILGCYNGDICKFHLRDAIYTHYNAIPGVCQASKESLQPFCFELQRNSSGWQCLDDNNWTTISLSRGNQPDLSDDVWIYRDVHNGVFHALGNGDVLGHNAFNHSVQVEIGSRQEFQQGAQKVSQIWGFRLGFHVLLRDDCSDYRSYSASAKSLEAPVLWDVVQGSQLQHTNLRSGSSNVNDCSE